MNLIFFTVLFPIITAIALILLPEKFIQEIADNSKPNKKVLCNRLNIYTLLVLVIESIMTFCCIFSCSDKMVDLFHITDILVISFKIDSVSKIFSGIVAIVWVLAGIYSFEYMSHEHNKKRYYVIYILNFGILNGLSFASNLITYYAFYELLTIGTFSLVIHNQSREAIMAAFKYLFYSFAGAYLVLFGIYFVQRYSIDPCISFREGGIIDYARACAEGVAALNGTELSSVSLNGGVLSVAMLFMILGFSVKAGMFPMHGWLPTAHPVAPAPASAVLSGLIVKAGVLGIIRVIYNIFGVEYFKGSYTQNIVLVLAIMTVFMGSMLAYREKLMKKRLAYSTVSQVSYILFGLFIADDTAYKGALLHVVAHALIKCTLFICIGSIIHITGLTRADELRGIGKRMPVMLMCYTIVSLGLIGIPPFGGFISKWYLCTGALMSGNMPYGFVGAVVLLISALLTAGYLLPISINGFLPGKDFDIESFDKEVKAYEPNLVMLVPIIILTALSVLIGIWPGVIL